MSVFRAEHSRYTNGHGNVGFEEEIYLARRLGIAEVSFVYNGGHGGGGSGGGEGCRPVAFERDGGDNNDLGVEEHYKRLLEENPSNPLYLRNYTQFLHQTKRDLQSEDQFDGFPTDFPSQNEQILPLPLVPVLAQ